MYIWTDKKQTGDFTIGELAKRANVNIETIRYYERRGLLKKPPRSALNYRIYSIEVLKRILFIKRAKKLGFTLEEIKELLSIREISTGQNYAVYELIKHKILEITRNMEKEQAQLKELRKQESECAKQDPDGECPLITALDSGEMLTSTD